MRYLPFSLLSLLVLPACVSDGISGDDVASLDCAAQRAQFDEAGGYAMTIGDDGVVYLGRGDAIARLGTDGSIDLLWQRRDGAIFDELAITETTLYANDRSSGVVAYELSAGAAQPGELIMTGDIARFGATGDRGGGLYFTRDSEPSIARLWPGGVVVSDVTTAPLPGAVGDVAFDEDGALLVLMMFGGDVYRIELDGAHREVSRTLLARTGLPFGLALDVDLEGRLYYGGQGTVYRLAAPYRAEDEEVLAEGLEPFAKVEVGRGAACPDDVYVSSTPGVALAP
jgi:hypothetical protein